MFTTRHHAASLRQYMLIGIAYSVFLSLSQQPIAANAGETNFVVSATVQKHASVKLMSQPGYLVVAAADVAQATWTFRSPRSW